MTIECKICQKKLAKQITNSHLKSHGTTTEEYKKLHGADSLTSPEYRLALSQGRRGENNSNYGNKWSDEKKEELSSMLQGKTPWNKDKKTGSTPEHQQGINNREEKYKNGVLQRRAGYHLTQDQKNAIGKGVAEYANKNQQEIKHRARKAVETKLSNNYDFGSNMRGRQHTPETKQLLAAQLQKYNLEKSVLSADKRMELILRANLTMINQQDDVMELCCNSCNSTFSLTQQCFTESKFKTNWCQTCNPPTHLYRSKSEIELFDFIKSLSEDAVNSNRRLLSKKEIDVYVPSRKIAIEFNGLYWHSESVLEQQGKSKHADYDKMTQAKKSGLRYIGIFEDEWLNKRNIVESRLRNILNCTRTIIFARKCKLNQINSQQAAKFCKDNHIQGAGRSNARYGLFYEDQLVSVMTFSKSNISRKISGWEINRFCNKIDTTVVGGASRLFQRFVKDHDPAEVISYADSRWSDGDLYKMLKFEYTKQTKPNYWYFLPNDLRRIHRYTLRKPQDAHKDLTEKDLRSMQGYLRIWDCGNTKWTWKKGS